ncbi:hypothetical protein PG997_007462 [Apiospora hydei]|uniref:Uncharacterized protein n=1 Tax=Apiospora hydei TaxID=1337664 RepID=A0ABR1W843_9PEZI
MQILKYSRPLLRAVAQRSVPRPVLGSVPGLDYVSLGRATHRFLQNVEKLFYVLGVDLRLWSERRSKIHELGDHDFDVILQRPDAFDQIVEEDSDDYLSNHLTRLFADWGIGIDDSVLLGECIPCPTFPGVKLWRGKLYLFVLLSDTSAFSLQSVRVVAAVEIPLGRIRLRFLILGRQERTEKLDPMFKFPYLLGPFIRLGLMISDNLLSVFGVATMSVRDAPGAFQQLLVLCDSCLLLSLARLGLRKLGLKLLQHRLFL